MAKGEVILSNDYVDWCCESWSRSIDAGQREELTNGVRSFCGILVIEDWDSISYFT